MTKLISRSTRLEAWLDATEHLLQVGSDFNIILDICSPSSDGPVTQAAYKRMDEFYAMEKESLPLHTVAETIFPAWEYSKRGLRGVFDSYEASFEIIKKGGGSRWGTYAHRLLRRQTGEGKVVNPLENLILKMRSEQKNKGPKTACYEIGVAEGEYDMPLYNTTDDAGARLGGPCLSHLSFKLNDNKVHLTAMYRSHDYRCKVPGNLLGLARLQACVAHEVGAEIGSLVTHSTYAWIDGSKRRLKQLVTDLRGLLAQEVAK